MVFTISCPSSFIRWSFHCVRLAWHRMAYVYFYIVNCVCMCCGIARLNIIISAREKITSFGSHTFLMEKKKRIIIIMYYNSRASVCVCMSVLAAIVVYSFFFSLSPHILYYFVLLFAFALCSGLLACCSLIELPVEFCSMMYKWCYLTASAAAVSTAAVWFFTWFRFRSFARSLDCILLLFLLLLFGLV